MSTGKIPGPYVNDTKQDDAIMEYVPFPTMDIGARRSGMPGGAMSGMRSIEHVGSSEGKRGNEPARGRTAKNK